MTLPAAMSHQDKLLLAELPDPNIELFFQKVPLTAFYPFQRLPIEIRFKIWHLIRARMIDARIVGDHHLKGFRPPPVTFSINQESRNETRNHYVDTSNMIFIKEYPEVLIEGLYAATDGGPFMPHYTFFDPLVDTLRFRNTIFRVWCF